MPYISLADGVGTTNNQPFTEQEIMAKTAKKAAPKKAVKKVATKAATKAAAKPAAPKPIKEALTKSGLVAHIAEATSVAAKDVRAVFAALEGAVAASVNKLRNDMNESARHSSTVSNVANVFGIGVNDALLYVAFLVTAIFDPVAVYLFTLYGKSVNIHTQRKEDVALSAYSSYAEQTDLRITELDKQVSLKLEEHAEKVAVALDLANRAHTEAFTHRDEINLLHKQVS